ncbi:hypothetical protein FCU45_06915 [Sulfurimonas crateris]|uniref:LPP20 family lipoprotein n=1 Tax=Sulfurimonas crateris TaxID=2574727 RepID=A0A4U2Z4Y0_9BACT|nr:hypothetical protein [Sulfurimonas crateris]TKI69247.1 hypothetical protein FCU45_06915 [Sulfurimonas crateris]
MRSLLYKIFLPLLLFLLSGCAFSPKPKEQLPLWVNEHSLTQAVGSSEVNFQGVYTQRAAALNEAKSSLAHNIRSYITSSLQSQSSVGNNKISNRYKDKIVALSELFLSDAHQVDAFFDSNRKLYILVESPQESIERVVGLGAQKNRTPLPALTTRPFDKEELIESRCYQRELLESINTKSELFQNKPVWFFRPNQGGVLGSVGIAEKEEGRSLAEQKRVALSLAKSTLIRDKKMQIKSRHELLKIVSDDINGEIFDSSAVIRSAESSFAAEIRDIWLDPQSCELYLWIVESDEV